MVYTEHPVVYTEDPVVYTEVLYTHVVYTEDPPRPEARAEAICPTVQAEQCSKVKKHGGMMLYAVWLGAVLHSMFHCSAVQ